LFREKICIYNPVKAKFLASSQIHYFYKGVFSMKKLIALVCLLVALPAAAKPEVQETAKLNEQGEYCARVEVRSVAGLTTRKTKCRTIAEWKEAGYEVSAKVVD
jgi:hypothetical protein